MPKNETAQNFIDRLIAVDEQPSEVEMAALRQQLRQKVSRMKHRGRFSMFICLTGGLLILLGCLCMSLALDGQREITWLVNSSFVIVVLGAIVVVVGCIGLLINRGFGYVWARHDYQETAITELSLQMNLLSNRIDELAKATRIAGASNSLKAQD